MDVLTIDHINATLPGNGEKTNPPDREEKASSEKRTRKDRKAKLSNRKNQFEVVVKACLLHVMLKTKMLNHHSVHIYTYSQRHPSPVRTAACYRLHFLAVHLDPERLPEKLACVSFSVLVFCTTNRLVLMAALKFRFLNGMRVLPEVELINARIP